MGNKIDLKEVSNAELLTEFKSRFQDSALYGLEIGKTLDLIGKESIQMHLSDEKAATKWKRVASKEQVKVGTKLKIIGFDEKDSIKCITVKKIIPYHGTEVILKRKQNLYFNLGGYLGEIETVGKWVKELYYQELTH